MQAHVRVRSNGLVAKEGQPLARKASMTRSPSSGASANHRDTNVRAAVRVKGKTINSRSDWESKGRQTDQDSRRADTTMVFPAWRPRISDRSVLKRRIAALASLGLSMSS